MKKNIQSYLDAAKKARNTQPLLSQDEILQHLHKAASTPSVAPSLWRRSPIIGSSLLVAASVAAILYSSQLFPEQSQPLAQSPTGSAIQIESKSETTSFTKPELISAQPDNNTIVTKAIIQPGKQQLQKNSTSTNINAEHISPIPLQAIPPPPEAPVLTNNRDIEGLQRLELSEREAIVLSSHYPKLHIWLQGTFTATDTCDITLAPSDKDKSASQFHHSAVLLKINFTHSDAREFLLWFTPNKEFTSALPGRYRDQLASELHALAEVETRCIPAEQACKAVKGDSPFFDLCRRESGALLGVSISPNPARDNAECTFTLKDQRDINISLHDLNGRFVRTMIFNELKPSGENKVPLMLEGVPAGAYLLAIRTERGEQAVQQLVVGQ